GDIGFIFGGDLAHETDVLALFEDEAATGKCANADFWSLQVDKYADRPAALGFEGANDPVIFSKPRVGGVTHIDAKDVGARIEQGADLVRRGRGRSKR